MMDGWMDGWKLKALIETLPMITNAPSEVFVFWLQNKSTGLNLCLQEQRLAGNFDRRVGTGEVTTNEGHGWVVDGDESFIPEMEHRAVHCKWMAVHSFQRRSRR